VRARVVLALVICALALSGCTLVPTNGNPVDLKRTQVKFGLLDPTIPGTNGATVHFVTQPVYVVDATGHLTPSSRIVPSPPALATVIEQLLLGPSAIEKSAGYSSALPKSLALLSAGVRREVGTIDFATSLDALSRSQRLLAVGQLVLTAYDVGATRGVVIKVAGVVQHIELPNGTTTTLATARDFESLLND